MDEKKLIEQFFEKNFTLFLGFHGQYIFLVDPSIGVHFIDEKQFDEKSTSFEFYFTIKS